MMKANNIALFGPMPPPIGGVSIHIQRLTRLLEKSGFQVSLVDEAPLRKNGIFNFRDLNMVKYFSIIFKSDLVHIHSSVSVLRVFHILVCLALRKNVVVTLHSWRVNNRISSSLQRIIMARVATVICVSRVIKQNIELENSIVKPAFIPPIMAQEPKLSRFIVDWVNDARKNGSTVLSSNAYRLDLYDSIDLYGLDMLIEAVRYLVREKSIDIVLVFVVSTLNQNEKLFYKYQRVIKNLELNSRIMLIHEKDLSFVRLVSISDITVRATNTDGDALSIRESLFLNKPVIASDVVERPVGTHLFKNRNQLSLNDNLLALIESLQYPVESNPIVDDYASFYKSIYQVK